MEKFDVIIIGAGIAGLSAALTAVRYGMRTALIEKENYIGGIAQDCFHTYICGLFENNTAAPFQIANPGICSDIFKFLFHCYGDRCLVKTGKVETLAFARQDLWRYFFRQLEKGDFSLFKQSKCMEIESKGSRIQKIKISVGKSAKGLVRRSSIQSEENFAKKSAKESDEKLDWKSARKSIEKKDIDLAADVFIDASGCSDLFENLEKNNKNFKGDNQLGGYCILLQGELKENLSLRLPYTARKIVEKYKFADYLRFVNITHNFLTKNYILKFSVRYPEDMEKCKFIYQKLNENIKSLGELTFVKSSEKIHSRGCSKIHGIDDTGDEAEEKKNNSNIYNNSYDASEYTGNKDQYADEICAVKSYWPMEQWDIKRGTKYIYCKDNKPFYITLSALKDKKFDNLFLSGTSIRVPENIHASARVMGVCMATGEQAVIHADKYLKNANKKRNIIKQEMSAK